MELLLDAAIETVKIYTIHRFKLKYRVCDMCIWIQTMNNKVFLTGTGLKSTSTTKKIWISSFVTRLVKPWKCIKQVSHFIRDTTVLDTSYFYTCGWNPRSSWAFAHYWDSSGVRTYVTNMTDTKNIKGIKHILHVDFIIWMLSNTKKQIGILQHWCRKHEHYCILKLLTFYIHQPPNVVSLTTIQ